MNNDYYRFKVGDFRCTVVSDGFYTYGPPNFPPAEYCVFVNAPKESIPSILKNHDLPVPWVEWVNPYNCLVIDTGKHLVLVDTGAGGLAPTTGKLLENLKAADISSDDIDIVIITHGHPDHLGGNIDAEEKPAFPGARYIISKDEWTFWTSGEAERKVAEHSRRILVDTALKNLLPLQKQVEKVDGEREIVTGISLIKVPGHTPGQIALDIISRNERLFYVSDAVLHPVHLERPEWFSIFDIDPEIMVKSRLKILERVSMEKTLVFVFHFTFPGLGRVYKEGKAYRWEPLNI